MRSGGRGVTHVRLGADARSEGGGATLGLRQAPLIVTIIFNNDHVLFALYMPLVIIDGPEHQESPPRPVSKIIRESMHACIVHARPCIDAYIVHAPLCMVERLQA